MSGEEASFCDFICDFEWCLVWYGYGYINQWDTSKQKVMKTMQKDFCVLKIIAKRVEGGHDAPPQTF